jgi:cell division ATPase FtsA
MNKKKYVAAIDIGTTKIVSGRIKKRRRQNKFHKQDSSRVKRGVVLNIEETVAPFKHGG